MSASAGGLTRRPHARRRRGPRGARVRAVLQHARAAGAAGVAWGWRRSTGPRWPTTSSARAPSAWAETAPPAAWPCSTCGGRAPAASRRPSCSAWRRARCPGRCVENPFLRADEAAALGIGRLDPGERDRHLFYTAVTRPWRQLFLCRQAADEEGRLREPSPFLEEVRRALGGADAAESGAARSATSPGRWRTAPTERERQRALARDAARPAGVGGGHRASQQRLGAQAGARPRRLPAAHAAAPTRRCWPRWPRQERFSVTELEKFADCSSAWFVERFLSPGEIDYEFGAKERGSVAHATLHRFHERHAHASSGVERLTERRTCPRAVALMRPLPGRRAGAASASPLARPGQEVGARGWSATWRASCAGEVDVRLAAGAARLRGAVRHQELAARACSRACGWTASPCPGTIDRIDRDPGDVRAGRGLGLQDRPRVPTRRQADRERAQRLQIPLYILAAARPARDRAGRRPVPRRWAASAEARGHGRRGRDRRRRPPTTSCSRELILGAGRPRGRLRQRRSSAGSGRATVRPRSAARAAAPSGACARPAASAGWRQ